MTGYGSRKTEADEVAQRIWAKALAIGGDEGAGPAVMITVENCGMTPEVRKTVADALQTTGVKNERLVVTVSHTHTGPTLKNWASSIFGSDIPPAELAHIDQYAKDLTEKMIQVARDALKSRRPGRLFRSEGKVGFAANRRVMVDGRWKGFGVQADGPVDHSLPMLVAKDENGKLITILANYACHCTTLGGNFNKIAGDWLGYASEFIEQENPGAVSLITIGCAADANPEPRRDDLKVCEQHGRAIADEVKRLLATDLKPVPADLTCKLTYIDLPFETLPTKEQWQERTKLPGPAGYLAKKYLEMVEQGKEIPKTYSYPIGVWLFGEPKPGAERMEPPALAMIFLGGEVVVDYAIRMKSEFDSSRLWITAYANDVPCYIPSKRILREGGYEADTSMALYGRPTRWAPEVEDLIMAAIQKLLPQTLYSPAKQAEFPPPKSPKESLGTIKVKPGFKVELVVAEPLIEDPVAFDWGPDGRLWVVEMRDYPNGQDWNGAGQTMGKPGGRIKVLTDTDGDGRYDHATLFLDDIPFPTGVKVWRKGVLISAAPLVFYAEDTDGDGKADKRETLFEGFGEGNQQHRVNGLRWGFDNWLYLGNGDSGGSIKSMKTGQTVNISGRDLRIRPDTGELEAQAGQTQFGRCRDDWGNWFGGNNSNPMWHYVLDDFYLRRNPHVAPPENRKQVSNGAGGGSCLSD